MTETYYRSSSGWLAAALRRIGSGDATDDLVQEAFIKAFEAAGEGARHPRALLLNIARNLLRDQWRRDNRRAHPEYLAAVDAHQPASVESSQYEDVLLQDILRTLSPLQREVFILGRFGGRSYAEISAMCGISVRAVERRMSEALAICAEALRSD